MTCRDIPWGQNREIRPWSRRLESGKPGSFVGPQRLVAPLGQAVGGEPERLAAVDDGLDDVGCQEGEVDQPCDPAFACEVRTPPTPSNPSLMALVEFVLSG